VLTDYNVAADAGGVRVAIVKSFTLTVSDGTLNIAITPTVDRARLAAIEVIRLSGGSGNGATQAEETDGQAQTYLPVIRQAAPAQAQLQSGGGSSTRTVTYSYDRLNRLTGANASVGDDYSYAYDRAGNRTSVTRNSTTTSRSYNAANQITTAGYSYDAAGNLLSDGTTPATYDALNRVLSQGATSYTYNGDGVLVQANTTRYVQDLAAPLSQILNDGTASYVYGLGRLRAVAGPWYLADALGSVRATLNDSGATLATAQYAPYGSVEGSAIAPFGFTGELQAGSSVYLRARWYNANEGRFASRDPFAGFDTLPYSLHSFQYAYANPVLYTDPSGEVVPIVIGGV
jgi:RHS repeat-associated protein